MQTYTNKNNSITTDMQKELYIHTENLEKELISTN
jgi:hypothetical protein